MKTERRRAVLITLGVIAAVIVISSIALRLFFTRERLLGIVVPRAEKAMNAEIEVGDIGIEFPFGFGVEAERISFRKQLEDDRGIHFSSEEVSVKASLVSLIRRKPRLSRVVVSGCMVEMTDPAGISSSVKGIHANMSVNPEDEQYVVNIDMKADTLLVMPAGGGRTGGTGLELDGVVKTALPSERKEGELFPRMTVDSDIRIKGFLVPVKIPETGITGTFNLSGLQIESDDLSISSGKMLSEIDFRLQFSRSAQPLLLDFESRSRADVGELAGMAGTGNPELTGSAQLNLDGHIRLPALKDGVPFDSDALSIQGKLKLEGINAAGTETLPAINDLGLEALINERSMKGITSEFKVAAEPFSLKGDMINIFPAMYRLYQIRSENEDFSPETFGRVFGRLDAGSKIELALSGGRFDATPFMPEKDEKDKVSEERTIPEQADIFSNPALANPFTLLILKNSTLSSEIDTVVTPYGPVSGINARVSVLDGKVRIRPVEAEYADGRIESAASADFTNLSRIATAANFSVKGLDSREALSQFSEAGELIHGRFDLNGTGRMNLTRHADPLNSLHARCGLFSGGGGVDFSKYLAPVSAAVGVDLSRYENFNFDRCDGDIVVSAGRILIKKFIMTSPDGRISGSGTVGFDNSLDCRATLIIPPEAQKRMKDLRKLGDIVEYLKDDEGNLVLGFNIGGNTESPKISFDQSGIREKAKKKMVDELKKKAVDKLKDLF